MQKSLTARTSLQDFHNFGVILSEINSNILTGENFSLKKARKLQFASKGDPTLTRFIIKSIKQ